MQKNSGFTLIELVVVIFILGILAAVATSKWIDLQTSARISTLNGIAGALQSTISMTRAKAFASGLTPAPTNPGGATQTGYILNFPFGSAEVDWRNLCPESRAEAGDALTMLDFIDLPSSNITTQLNNQYTLIGYDIPGFSNPSNQGCYVIYDSFGSPNCTVEVITTDC